MRHCRRRRTAALATCLCAGLLAGCAGPRGSRLAVDQPPGPSPHALMVYLREAYQAGRDQEVVELAEQLARRYPGDPFRGRALLLRARAEVRLGSYAAAVATLERFLLDYPGHPLRDDARELWQAALRARDGRSPMPSAGPPTLPEEARPIPPAAGQDAGGPDHATPGGQPVAPGDAVASGNASEQRETPTPPRARPAEPPRYPFRAGRVEGRVSTRAPEQAPRLPSEGEPDAALPAPGGLAAASAATPRSTRLRGTQILLVGAESRAALADLLDGLAQAGLNCVIVRMFQNRGDRPHRVADSRPQRGYPAGNPVVPGVYFRSEAAPLVHDLLADLVELAPARGLQVFAWMTTRYLDWLTGPRPDLLDSLFDPATGGFAPARGASVHHPEVRRHLVTLYRDLARYPISGILFQDDLVSREREGFAPTDLEAYRLQSGRQPVPEDLFQGFSEVEPGRFRASGYRPGYAPWVDFKVRSLLDLATTLLREARAVRPELRSILNLYYETLSAPEHGRLWVAQDLDAARAAGFDYLAFMTYHRQIGRELHLEGAALYDLLARMARDAVARVGDPDRVILKLQTHDWEDLAAVDQGELEEVMDAFRVGAGTTSLLYVPHTAQVPLARIGELFR